MNSLGQIPIALYWRRYLWQTSPDRPPLPESMLLTGCECWRSQQAWAQEPGMATVSAVGQPPGQQRWGYPSNKFKNWDGGPRRHIGHISRPRGRTGLPCLSVFREPRAWACRNPGMLLPNSDGRQGSQPGCLPEMGPCGSSSRRDGLGQQRNGNASAGGLFFP